MDFSKFRDVKKLCMIVNIGLMCCVIGMDIAFLLGGVKIMAIFCVPILLGYFINFIFIRRGRLDIYVWLTYGMMVSYMCVATICLGYSYGFTLYCMSIIPIVFYADYMSTVLKTPSTRPVLVSCIIVVADMICTLYTVFAGPIYVVNDSYKGGFLAFNTISVFFFLITYGAIQLKLTIQSEEKLKNMAMSDRLTGLYNRHYMVTCLQEVEKNQNTSQWLAIIDIDNFKKINDTYGHNAGDYVLAHLSELAKEICPNCTISRWGGEEFVVTASGSDASFNVIEKLRAAVAEKPFVCNNVEIKVTFTAGISCYEAGDSWDYFVSKADKNLYKGKHSGKNVVVQELTF